MIRRSCNYIDIFQTSIRIKLKSVSRIVEVLVVPALVSAAGVGPHGALPLDPLVGYPLVPHRHGTSRVVGPGVAQTVRPSPVCGERKVRFVSSPVVQPEEDRASLRSDGHTVPSEHCPPARED